MPKEIISHRKKEDNLYFTITRSKETLDYTIDIVKPGNFAERLYYNSKGIQVSRRWIASYIKENFEKLPLSYEGNETVITDRCVKPGRTKDAWNQWEIGSYL